MNLPSFIFLQTASNIQVPVRLQKWRMLQRIIIGIKNRPGHVTYHTQMQQIQRAWKAIKKLLTIGIKQYNQYSPVQLNTRWIMLKDTFESTFLWKHVERPERTIFMKYKCAFWLALPWLLILKGKLTSEVINCFALNIQYCDIYH